MSIPNFFSCLPNSLRTRLVLRIRIPAGAGPRLRRLRRPADDGLFRTAPVEGTERDLLGVGRRDGLVGRDRRAVRPRAGTPHPQDRFPQPAAPLGPAVRHPAPRRPHGGAFLPVKLDGEYTQTNIINTSSILNNQTDPNSGKQGFSPEGVGNPVELLERMQAMQYRTQIFGNAALTFHLMKGLDLKTQFGIDYHNNRDANYTPFTPRPMINQSSEGAASANNSNSLYWQEETYLTYVKDINKHHINAMAGMSWQEYNYTKFEASDSKYIDDFYGYYNLGSGTNRPSVGNDYDKWAMNSYFLRLAYSYDNKYMATVTGRYDGSSKFGQNNKYAFFPSVGLGWMISNEDFLKDNSLISKLKLHTSYGLTGNSEIGTYKSLATVSQSNTIIGDALHVVVSLP